MKLIAHRGNINGPNPQNENNPSYLLETLSKGYDIEIDLWCVNNNLYLGHDEPQYTITLDFLQKNNLWIHCKNIPALEYCKDRNITNPYFFHDQDDTTLTSNGLFWTFPGKFLTKHSIAVMPERSPGWLTRNMNIFGICSDLLIEFKDL